MRAKKLLGILLFLVLALPVAGLAAKPADTLPTPSGDVTVTFLGHGTLMLQWQGKTIHIDPWSPQGDYAVLPKADLILITHEHYDHLDPAAIAATRKPGTVIVASRKAGRGLDGAVTLKNGESTTQLGLKIDAVPAYNIEHMRTPGQPFHPRGEGNGYVLHFGAFRLYVAGDTEPIPEMSALRGVDVAFLPVNLPYTMTIGMLVEAARTIQPKVLYPYHTGDTDMAKAVEALRAVPGVEVRVRPMK